MNLQTITVLASLLLASGCAGASSRHPDPVVSTGSLTVGVLSTLPAPWHVDALTLWVAGEKAVVAESYESDAELVAPVEPGETRILYRGDLPAGLVNVGLEARLATEGTKLATEIGTSVELELAPRAVGLLVTLSEGPAGPEAVIAQVPLATLEGEQMCVDAVPVEQPDCATDP